MHSGTILTKIGDFSLLCDFKEFSKSIKRILKLEEPEHTKSDKNLEILKSQKNNKRQKNARLMGARQDSSGQLGLLYLIIHFCQVKFLLCEYWIP